MKAFQIIISFRNLCLGFITLCFIKEDLGRQRAENDEK